MSKWGMCTPARLAEDAGHMGYTNEWYRDTPEWRAYHHKKISDAFDAASKSEIIELRPVVIDDDGIPETTNVAQQFLYPGQQMKFSFG